VKIRKVETNNRKGEIRIVTYSGDSYVFPYVKADPQPDSADRVADAVADPELGKEAFTYTLESGDEGTVHLDQVLEYNEDPTYLRDLLIHQLTVEAKERVEESGLSRRELARRLNQDPEQVPEDIEHTARSRVAFKSISNQG
jgi:hypothetical protein